MAEAERKETPAAASGEKAAATSGGANGTAAMEVDEPKGPPKALGPGGDETPAAAGAPKALGPSGGDTASDGGAAGAAAQPAAASDAVSGNKADPKAAAAKAASPPAEPAKPLPFQLRADSCVMQGRRPKQEDRNVKVPDLTKAAKALKMPIDHLEQPCAFFGVYDGHQGHLCAEYVAKNFHMKLLKRLTAERDAKAWEDDSKFTVIFREIFDELDTEFLTKFRTAPDGCTVVVCLIIGHRCFTAWCGDSRCVLARRSSKGDLVPVALTEDHRPSDKVEAERVKKAGGLVIDAGFTARVAHQGYEERIRELRRAQAQGMGMIGKEPVALAVSRALGDRDFKAVTGKALLVPTPDVRCIKLERSHKFLALMCDGIPDVLRNEEVVEELAITREPDATADVRAACGALVQEAYKKGSQDNLTVVMARIEWAGAAADDHKHKRKAGQDVAALSQSAAAASKKRRLEAAEKVKSQKVAAFERVSGGSQKEVTESTFVRFGEEDKAGEADGDITGDEAEAPKAPGGEAAPPAASSSSSSAAAAAKEGAKPSGEEVELTGLPRADLNGQRGVVVKTISDGRRVVRLSDGRELAFKQENLQPAKGAAASASTTSTAAGASSSAAGGAAKATAPAAAAAAAVAAKPAQEPDVEVVGHPRADMNGLKGNVVKTISDGRKVVRLSDGRELAFKAEQLKAPSTETAAADKTTGAASSVAPAAPKAADPPKAAEAAPAAKKQEEAPKPAASKPASKLTFI
eukprot:TRINITY_DN75443_c0_g1_i1.p1 TRINITY_DN75443_c0_g1~~TRINITY_DN75443_c0_g1_i1.p1  ORF type:complete len:748 (-),score=253.91 TRINITY_DN75443_c0_g1_i1:80-2323(-)